MQVWWTATDERPPNSGLPVRFSNKSWSNDIEVVLFTRGWEHYLLCYIYTYMHICAYTYMHRYIRSHRRPPRSSWIMIIASKNNSRKLLPLQLKVANEYCCMLLCRRICPSVLWGCTCHFPLPSFLYALFVTYHIHIKMYISPLILVCVRYVEYRYIYNSTAQLLYYEQRDIVEIE